MSFRFFITVIVVAAIGYGVLWSVSARRMSDLVDQQFDSTKLGPALKVDTSKRRVEGFPYRLTVILEDVRVTTEDGSFVGAADRIEAVTHLWTPGHWVITARDVQVDLPILGTLREGIVSASYKRRASGHAGVFIGSGESGDTQAAKVPGLTDWSLSIGIPGASEDDDSGLYSDIAAFLQLRASLGGNRFETKGQILSAPPFGTSRDALSAWRDAGGLIEFDAFSANVGSHTVKGNASVGLDDTLTPLGSVAVDGDAPGDLAAVLAALGVAGYQGDSGSLILQNGRAVLDGEVLTPLRPIHRY